MHAFPARAHSERQRGAMMQPFHRKHTIKQTNKFNSNNNNNKKKSNSSAAACCELLFTLLEKTDASGAENFLFPLRQSPERRSKKLRVPMRSLWSRIIQHPDSPARVARKRLRLCTPLSQDSPSPGKGPITITSSVFRLTLHHYAVIVVDTSPLEA